MAAQARVKHLFRRELGEGDDSGFTSVCGYVPLPRAMATFAASVGRSFFAGGDALEVSIFIEPEPDIWMAGLANHASDVPVLRGIGC